MQHSTEDGTPTPATRLREPYVGEGIDGCLRSAQIDREEADCLDLNDPRYAEVIASAASWERQAEQLAQQNSGVRRPENERRVPSVAEPPGNAPSR
jgi:hypothetical protein